MKNIIKQIVSVIFLLVFTQLVMAHPAQDLVENNTLEVMRILTDDREKLQNDPEYLQQVVDEKIIPHLDLNAMTALSVGKNWRSASDEQRSELISEFKQLLLNTYMSALTLYSGQQMEFKPFLPQKREDRAIVRAVFLQPGNKGVPINYKLREKDSSWKIYDIDVNNINLVATYRSAFSQKISQSGIDGLIEEMRQKNAKVEEAKNN